MLESSLHSRVGLLQRYAAVANQLLRLKDTAQCAGDTRRLNWLAKNFATVAKNFLEISEFLRASELFEQAKRCDSRYHSWYHDWFHALERCNQLAKAEALQKKIIENDKDSPKSLLNQCQLDIRNKRYQSALTTITPLNTLDLNDTLTIRAKLLEGRILDKTGSYAKAFSAWSQANQRVFNSEAARQLLPQANQLLQDVENSRIWYKDKANHTPSNLAPNDRKSSPIFLVGFPRSGTTLLDQVLHSHSTITVLEERAPVRAFANQFFGASNKLTQLKQLSTEQLSNYRDKYWATVRDWVDLPDNHVFIDKLPMSIRHIEVILYLFPAARFLVCLRHPGDVMLSNFTQPYLLNPAMLHSFSLPHLTKLYAAIMGLYAESRERVSAEVIHEVRYESMINDLQGTIQNVLEFLGLPWEESVLNYQQTAAMRNIKTPSYEQVVQPIYTTSVNRWRHYEQELAVELAALSDICDELGYDLD